MSGICTVRYQGQDKDLVLVNGADSLSRLLFVHGFFRGHPLCSGAGKCGYCRVRFLEGVPEPYRVEQDLFSPEELQHGWRLSCRHVPVSGMLFELPDTRPERQAGAGSTGGAGRRVGIDIGTTIIKWMDCADSSNGLDNSMPNPQMGAGSEVMARVAFEEGTGRGILGETIRSAVYDIARESDEVVITGNSVMIALLLGKSLTGLGRAPYSLPYLGGQWESGIAGSGVVYIPSLLAPFLGADVSSGLTHIIRGMDPPPKYPFLYADMGTNAEFVLGLDPATWLMASVPMGPALEGVGLRFGAPAGDGVITSFELSPFGLDAAILGGSDPRAISGTGYISLLACLKRAGVVDHTGRFQQPVSPVAARIVGSSAAGAVHRVPVAGGMYLDGEDVEEILKVKGAWNLAISALLGEAKIVPAMLQAVYLAGSFGFHVQGADLEELGFLPLGGGEKIRCVGNAALLGGCLLLESAAARQWCEELRDRTRVVDLLEADPSGNGLLDRMRFSFVP